MLALSAIKLVLEASLAYLEHPTSWKEFVSLNGLQLGISNLGGSKVLRHEIVNESKRRIDHQVPSRWWEQA